MIPTERTLFQFLPQVVWVLFDSFPERFSRTSLSGVLLLLKVVFIFTHTTCLSALEGPRVQEAALRADESDAIVLPVGPLLAFFCSAVLVLITGTDNRETSSYGNVAVRLALRSCGQHASGGVSTTASSI